MYDAYIATFPHSVMIARSNIGSSEPIEWLRKNHYTRNTFVGGRHWGDYVFLTDREFLFRDEMIAIEFKLLFG